MPCIPSDRDITILYPEGTAAIDTIRQSLRPMLSAKQRKQLELYRAHTPRAACIKRLGIYIAILRPDDPYLC